jgi:hypothetical protein
MDLVAVAIDDLMALTLEPSSPNASVMPLARRWPRVLDRLKGVVRCCLTLSHKTLSLELHSSQRPCLTPSVADQIQGE